MEDSDLQFDNIVSLAFHYIAGSGSVEKKFRILIPVFSVIFESSSEFTVKIIERKKKFILISPNYTKF